MAESYRQWRASRLGEITDALEHRLISDLLGPLAGERLLDVGCGDGLLASQLARRGALVTGLDADAEMLAAAKRRMAAPYHLAAGRAESLPFADASFDGVVAVTVLCFVRGAERALAETARVLKPGGRLVIGELGRWSLWAAERRVRGWLGHPTWRAAAFRSAAELHGLVGAAGLDVTAVRGAVYYPPCAAAARLVAPLDPWLGRTTTLGAAFIALSARKPKGVKSKVASG